MHFVQQQPMANTQGLNTGFIMSYLHAPEATGQSSDHAWGQTLHQLWGLHSSLYLPGPLSESAWVGLRLDGF